MTSQRKAAASTPKLSRTRYFSRMNYQVQRGLREILNERFISIEEWRIILDFFDRRCAFCGREHTGNNRTGIVPDHLIPASKFGELCIGNTVPACQDCNDKRGDNDWLQFLRSFPKKHSRKPEVRIREYLKKFPYEPIDNPAQALSRKKHNEFVRLLETWASLWRDARILRDNVRMRKTMRNLTNRCS
jgi:hypothetical protein